MNPELLNKLGIQLNEIKTEFTVIEIQNSIKNMLERDYDCVRVVGQITNYKHHIYGHHYFSLIDNINPTIDNLLKQTNESSNTPTLQAVCWKSIKTPQLSDGMKVIITGKITAYKSQFQIIASRIEVVGVNTLAKAQLKALFEQEGLFDIRHKKALPKFPQKIGIITAHNSDAEKDILKRIEGRFAKHVLIHNVLVQGHEAASQICKAIDFFQNQVNVIIISRGGGSDEDLDVFNSEAIVRAIFSSNIPIITGIGHEADTTLADYVADMRAPTPTACIDLVCEKTENLTAKIVNLHTFIQQFIKEKTTILNQQTAHLTQIHNTLLNHLIDKKQLEFNIIEKTLKLTLNNKITLLKHTVPSLPSLIHILTIAQNKLEKTMLNLKIEKFIENKKTQLAQLTQILDNISHYHVLKRGFAIVSDKNGNVITNATNTHHNQQLHIQFSDNALNVRVEAES